MAGSVNKVILVGNLGNDPSIRTTQDGKEICNLSVATSESWKDRNTGERREKTEWHRVVIFNDNLVRIARDFLRKGSKVYLEGALQTRKWVDQSGQEKYSTEIILQGFNGVLTLLDSKRESEARAASYASANSGADMQSGVQEAVSRQAATAPVLDDEIPF